MSSIDLFFPRINISHPCDNLKSNTGHKITYIVIVIISSIFIGGGAAAMALSSYYFAVIPVCTLGIDALFIFIKIRSPSLEKMNDGPKMGSPVLPSAVDNYTTPINRVLSTDTTFLDEDPSEPLQQPLHEENPDVYKLDIVESIVSEAPPEDLLSHKINSILTFQKYVSPTELSSQKQHPLFLSKLLMKIGKNELLKFFEELSLLSQGDEYISFFSNLNFCSTSLPSNINTSFFFFQFVPLLTYFFCERIRNDRNDELYSLFLQNKEEIVKEILTLLEQEEIVLQKDLLQCLYFIIDNLIELIPPIANLTRFFFDSSLLSRFFADLFLSQLNTIKMHEKKGIEDSLKLAEEKHFNNIEKKSKEENGINKLIEIHIFTEFTAQFIEILFSIFHSNHRKNNLIDLNNFQLKLSEKYTQIKSIFEENAKISDVLNLEINSKKLNSPIQPLNDTDLLSLRPYFDKVTTKIFNNIKIPLIKIPFFLETLDNKKDYIKLLNEIKKFGPVIEEQRKRLFSEMSAGEFMIKNQILARTFWKLLSLPAGETIIANLEVFFIKSMKSAGIDTHKIELFIKKEIHAYRIKFINLINEPSFQYFPYQDFFMILLLGILGAENLYHLRPFISENIEPVIKILIEASPKFKKHKTKINVAVKAALAFLKPLNGILQRKMPGKSLAIKAAINASFFSLHAFKKLTEEEENILDLLKGVFSYFILGVFGSSEKELKSMEAFKKKIEAVYVNLYQFDCMRSQDREYLESHILKQFDLHV